MPQRGYSGGYLQVEIGSLARDEDAQQLHPTQKGNHDLKDVISYFD